MYLADLVLWLDNPQPKMVYVEDFPLAVSGNLQYRNIITNLDGLSKVT